MSYLAIASVNSRGNYQVQLKSMTAMCWIFQKVTWYFVNDLTCLKRTECCLFL